MTALPEDERTPLVRSDLGGFPRPVQNALLGAFRAGAGYRLTDGQHILLYGTLEGKAGSLKVSGARQAEASVRYIQKWIADNYPTDTTRKLTMVVPPENVLEQGLRELPRGFTLFRNKRTKAENRLIATNGKKFLCRVCGESMDTAVGASAHTRNAHERGMDVGEGEVEATVEATPEKPVITIDIEPFDLEGPLPKPSDWGPGDDPRVMQAINLLIEVASDDMKDVIADLEARNAELQTRLDECEARLSLVRETLGL